MKRLLLIAGLLLCAAPAFAEGPVLKLYAGVNGLWYDGSMGLPNDFEAGANGRASLSQHISLVASGYHGFKEEYNRGSVGTRITATDATNPDFSVGFGIQRHFSSDHAIRPEEWAPDASVGWRPWPQNNPKLVVVAQGNYGLDSNQASVLAGLRYALTGGGQ